MARLTERFSNGQAASYWCGSNCKYDHKYCRENLENCPAMEDILEKLAHYEDLEEAGRLVVLPDRKSRTLLSKALLNSDICPRNLGMEEIDPCTPDADCEACWEAALEGCGQDE